MYKLFIFSLVSLYANFSFGAVCDTVIYKGENETYIEASAENGGSVLYDKEIRDKPRTRRTKRNV